MAINPNLVSIIPASELPTGTPTTAGQFFFYEGNEMKKSPMTEIYKSVSGLKGTLKITDTAPTTQGLYILSDVGTYTNLGGLVTTTGKINYAYFDGTTWKLISVEMPNDAVDNLTSTSTTAKLSANMGRFLDEKKADKNLLFENLIVDFDLKTMANSQGYYDNGNVSEDELLINFNYQRLIINGNFSMKTPTDSVWTHNIKITARTLIAKGIKSGDWVQFGIKLKLDKTNGNNFIIFGDGYSGINLTNTNWYFLVVKKQITFTNINEVITLLSFNLDNTHGATTEFVSFKNLTLIKCEENTSLINDSINPNIDKRNIGKNLIVDKNFDLSEKYTRFLDLNPEGTTFDKSISNTTYNGESVKCLKIENFANSPISFSLNYEINNNSKKKYYQKGFKIKITPKTTTAEKFAFVTFFDKGAYDSFAPKNFSIELNKWVECVSPTYFAKNNKINFSFRLNVPSGQFKVEIIEPCMITKSINDELFYFTDSQDLGLQHLGDKFTFIGDSLIDGGGWQKIVQDKLGCKIFLIGVGSAKVAGNLFPTWINPTTKEHITNINYNAYPPQLDISSLNNYNSNCINFKGIFGFQADRDRVITSPNLGDYIWWSNGELSPNYKRQYYNGTSWITDSETVVDANEGVLYSTINGMITSIDRANLIPQDSDYIFFMGGTNDWQAAVGDITDFGGNTFIGRIREALKWWHITAPKATIYLMTFPRAITEFTAENIDSDGLIRDNYRDAIRLISKKYGYNLIEMHNSIPKDLIGIMTDDGVHPNYLGSEFYAKNFCNNFK